MNDNLPEGVEPEDVEAARDYLTALVHARNPLSPPVTTIRRDHPAIAHFARHRRESLRRAAEPVPKPVKAVDDDQALAARLTCEQKAALLPCANDRTSLVKNGLAHWSRRFGHRFPSLKLSTRGYRLRKIIHGI